MIALDPAAIVVGTPVTVNGPPLGAAVIEVMVSAALPVLLSVMGT